MISNDASRMYLIGGRPPAPDLPPDVVGGKAAQLVRLDRLGLKVPPALALTTALSRDYMKRGALPDGFRNLLAGAIRQLEEATGSTLGGHRPLFVSVRSSPPVSMPGMLNTVLNVGSTEESIRALLRHTGNPWLAWDVYRRFIRSLAASLSRDSLAALDRLAAEHTGRAGVETIQDFDPIALRDLARASAAALATTTGHPIPSDPLAQIIPAVEAVLQSWNSPSAREYRRLNRVDEGTGTGVLIQAMVFGNSSYRSGSGVGFTRNPATGDREMYVDFLFNAQGEDVVAGRLPVIAADLLPSALPEVWAELRAAQTALEREFHDMQDFEFTVNEGQLFFLQTRRGKRTPWAALRIAADLVHEGILEPAAALEQLEPLDLDAIAHVVAKPGPEDVPLARATPASVGVASGTIVLDAKRAQRCTPHQSVILVRPDLTTDDVGGLAAAAGVLTRFGGRTSHAAVVARQLGKVCLVGCADLRVDEAARVCSIGTTLLREGDEITLDGESGFVYGGRVPIVTERPEEDLALVGRWRAS